MIERCLLLGRALIIFLCPIATIFFCGQVIFILTCSGLEETFLVNINYEKRSLSSIYFGGGLAASDRSIFAVYFLLKHLFSRQIIFIQ